MKTHQYQGFTLVELLVTLVIASVLIGAALPRLSGVFNAFSASASAEELISTLAYARGQAVFRQEAVLVCSGTNSCTGGNDWSGGWIVFIDGDGDGNFTNGVPTDELLKVVESNNTSVAITHTAGQVVFDELGEYTALAATNFTVCGDSTNNNANKIISLELVGYVESQVGVACP